MLSEFVPLEVILEIRWSKPMPIDHGSSYRAVPFSGIRCRPNGPQLSCGQPERSEGGRQLQLLVGRRQSPHAFAAIDPLHAHLADEPRVQSLFSTRAPKFAARLAW
jgi:hypothetical protein